MVEQQLDRFIDIELAEDSSFYKGSVLRLATPLTGVKQDMSLSGSFLPSYMASDITLRCTNFYTREPLDRYNALRITAGYKTGRSAVLEGPLIMPYLEKPSPDSVMVFRILGVAFYLEYTSLPFSVTWEEDTLVEDIITQCAKRLSTGNLKVNTYYKTTALRTTQKLQFTEEHKVRDVFQALLRMYPDLRIVLRGKDIVVCDAKVGTNIVHELRQISMAIKDGASISVHAPWDPTIAALDIIRLDTAFFKQGVGASLLTFTPTTIYDIPSAQIGGRNVVDFVVTTVDFSFSTSKMNNMVINAVVKDKVGSTL